MRRLYFLGLEPRFDFAHGIERMLALGHDHSDRQAGRTEQQHKQLEFRECIGVIAVAVQQPDQAELCDGKTYAGAVEPVARGGDHDR